MSFDLKLEQGDIQVNSEADLARVENGEKLTQDILKILGTQIGANTRFPWYGSPLSQSMIGRAFDTLFVESTATNQIKFSITNLQRLQVEQLRSDQYVTPQEQIAALQNISVNRNSIDPRFFEIDLIVLSKAFRRVPVSFSVTL